MSRCFPFLEKNTFKYGQVCRSPKFVKFFWCQAPTCSLCRDYAMTLKSGESASSHTVSTVTWLETCLWTLATYWLRHWLKCGWSTLCHNHLFNFMCESCLLEPSQPSVIADVLPSLWLQNFPCQEVERHNKPEVEFKWVLQGHVGHLQPFSMLHSS